MRKFRRNSQINKTTGTIFLLLLIALGIIGYSYSHWQETINIQSTLNMAEFKILIQNYNTTLTAQMSLDNHILELTGTITPGQTIWTGIIIKNNGTTPATITYEITTNNKAIWDTYFTHNEYFYEPYTTDPPPEVWNNSPTLPPTEGLSTPPELPAKNNLVTWQNITLSDTPTEAFTIEITVAYTATFSTWTDTVYVKYTLTLPTP
jgi:hypothetical protein